MSIEILWQEDVSGLPTQKRVVLPHAELVLKLVGNTLVESSWEPRGMLRVDSETVIVRQLREFLSFPDTLPFQIKLQRQGTVYSQKIWQSLLEIPFGQVVSYSDLAAKLNSGPRAVAQACKANPYAGIIPCHRVVAKSGCGGFMGQNKGLFVLLKQQLLAYEQQRVENPS